MKPNLWDSLRAAFNARPIGMVVPPNWIGLAAFGLLGLVNPGFWVLGTGLEAAYLTILAMNPRFQRAVAATRVSENTRAWQAKLDSLVARLGEADRRRYVALAGRCRSILDQQSHGVELPAGLEAQAESLGRLAWTYLRLLLTRRAINQLLDKAPGGEGEHDQLDDRIRQLQARLDKPSVSDELRRSLSGQIDILQQRLERRAEARHKLAFLDAELTRIEQQVELVREQAVLSTDPERLSRRIDEIASMLDGTAQWIRDQQQVYGATEDLLAEAPPLTFQTDTKESQ